MSKITLAEGVLTSAKTEMGLQNSSNRTSLELKPRTCAIAAHVRVSAFNRISSVGGISDSRHLVAIRRSFGQQRVLCAPSDRLIRVSFML